MSIKDALLYVSPLAGPSGEITAVYAAALAAHFGAEVTGVSIAFEVPYPITLYVPLPDDSALRERRQRDSERAVMAVTEAKAVFDRAGSSFFSVVESGDTVEALDLLVQYARLRDITILPNRTEKTLFERNLIESILFNSGRPVLLVPDAGRTGFGAERIMIAWDFSRPAVRAVSDAMPFLARAKRVYVVTATDDKELRPRQNAVEFGRHLAHHGVEIIVEPITRGDRGIGDALQGHAATVSADLLVMGGFGHSRFRDFILGGATRSVLAGASIPILMSH